MAYVLRSRGGYTVRFEPLVSGIIESESESYSSSVTSSPIEDGSEINDHVDNESGTLSISGTIIGGEWAVNALKQMRDSRDILTYIGVTRMTNLVFTNLKFDRTYKNKRGASFSATLKQIQINSSEYVPMDTEMSMASQDTGKSDDQQLAKTANTGVTTVAVQSVSSESYSRYLALYGGGSSSAPLSRMTGGYDGLSV